MEAVVLIVSVVEVTYVTSGIGMSLDFVIEEAVNVVVAAAAEAVAACRF